MKIIITLCITIILVNTAITANGQYTGTINIPMNK